MPEVKPSESICLEMEANNTRLSVTLLVLPEQINEHGGVERLLEKLRNKLTPLLKKIPDGKSYKASAEKSIISVSEKFLVSHSPQSAYPDYAAWCAKNHTQPLEIEGFVGKSTVDKLDPYSPFFNFLIIKKYEFEIGSIVKRTDVKTKNHLKITKITPKCCIKIGNERMAWPARFYEPSEKKTKRSKSKRGQKSKGPKRSNGTC